MKNSIKAKTPSFRNLKKIYNIRDTPALNNVSNIGAGVAVAVVVVAAEAVVVVVLSVVVANDAVANINNINDKTLTQTASMISFIDIL